MRTSIFLSFIHLLLSYAVTAQPKKSINYSQLQISNPRLLVKLKPFLQQQKGEIYICTSRLGYDQMEYTLRPVGYLSELKERTTSLYINLESSLIFIVTGIEPLVDSEQFFNEVIRPLVKGRLVNDVLPNGQRDPDAVPSTFDARTLFITMGRETIRVRWINN